MDNRTFDISKISDQYARAKIDAEMILVLCTGISQMKSEIQALKETISVLETVYKEDSKSANPEKAFLKNGVSLAK